MDVFTHRQQYETIGRNVQLSAMIKHPEHFLPVPLLVEDIYLGLCGLTVEILESEHTRVISGTVDLAAARLIRDSVTNRLTIWFAHIDDVTQKLSSDVLNPTDDALLVNYLARENEAQALSSSRAVVRQRIQDILSDTMIVCHQLETLLSTSN